MEYANTIGNENNEQRIYLSCPAKRAINGNQRTTYGLIEEIIVSKKIILIVDDQAELRKLVRMTLECDDYELHEAKDGQQALTLAKLLQPDLVILDIMMPGEIDGYQVCKKLKEECSEKIASVILLTAKGQMTDLKEGIRAGADNYLIKPFSPLELIEYVENALAQ
jgi:DNA-binding response OmpR family regulator